MSKDILSMYGADSASDQQPRATSGGVMKAKPLAYDPPKGPSNINDGRSAGLHGSNHGCCGTQGKH